MNKAQRLVLFLAVAAIIAMCAFPPAADAYRVTYKPIWNMYWEGGSRITMSFLLGQITIVLIIAVLLVLAFKSSAKSQ